MAALALLNENPHYFQFRGKPAVLIGSGEHYGGVLNGDFDYKRYFAALEKAGLNLTRTFSGTYREVPSSFKIVNNTLSPAPDSFVCPWARSEEPGEAMGGNKFDLTRYDDAYFARLKDFVAEADRRGVVVELVFFCVLYKDELWDVSPMNLANNINGLGQAGKDRIFTVEDNDLLPVHLDLVNKITHELRDFENLYYEVMNEPYVTDKKGSHMAWQRRIVDAIAETESGSSNPHLIAMNIANKDANIGELHPQVSVINFHYAEPASVFNNNQFDRPIVDDETGFKGQEAAPYRKEAWKFMLSGGAGVSHLDYSFTIYHPDGTAPIEGETPGYGGEDLRRQFRILKELIESLNLTCAMPMQEFLAGDVPEDVIVHAFGEPGKSCIIYIDGSIGQLSIDLAAGGYEVEWLDVLTGERTKQDSLDHPGGILDLKPPDYADDVAVIVTAQ